jgi:ABC-type branched-subunit amino acid transport system substrate-binding protein
MTNQAETKPTIGKDLARIVAGAQVQAGLGHTTPESFQTVADTIANATRGLGVEQTTEKPVQTT